MESLQRNQTRISTNIQEMEHFCTLEDWSALRELALSCQILTIRQIESYNGIVKVLTAKDVIKRVQHNVESLKYNSSKLQTIIQHATHLKNKISSFTLQI